MRQFLYYAFSVIKYWIHFKLLRKREVWITTTFHKGSVCVRRLKSWTYALQYLSNHKKIVDKHYLGNASGWNLINK